MIRQRLLVGLLAAVASNACASSSPEHGVPASSATQEPATSEPATSSQPRAAGAVPHVEVTITDDPAAEAVFKSENAKLMACYEAELRGDPTITIQWIGTFDTEPSGAVSKVFLVGVHEALAECISGVIKGTKHNGKGTRTLIVTMWTGDDKPKL